MRCLSDEEYLAIAKQNQDCLDYSKIIKRSLFKSNDWVIVDNEYPYIEYEGLKVIKHLLIVPSDDTRLSFVDLSIGELNSLRGCIDFCNSLSCISCKQTVFIWKEKGKTVNKLHLHFIALK